MKCIQLFVLFLGILLNAMQTSGYAQKNLLEGKPKELAWTDHPLETGWLFSTALPGENLRSATYWWDNIQGNF